MPNTFYYSDNLQVMRERLPAKVGKYGNPHIVTLDSHFRWGDHEEEMIVSMA